VAIVYRTCQPTIIETRGGVLEVEFSTTDFKKFSNIQLIGPAEKVFEGDLPDAP
jgi:diaminopimelate epimerase